ncbi:MAG TPA: thioredoxin [Chitinophagales bacterium]|jgi:thioredoxin 1|nr:thioredoxin [Chitinophagales bacterium]HPA36956.1 thioredoxin [Chitinophagales bacterium]HQD12572.1 thioredoxin [Chitinophagales bacterium]HQO32878.1 thioredoxin [Chitinophagales bacterium]HQO89332.1 thioredoxin [Chitinophagales bacterium]
MALELTNDNFKEKVLDTKGVALVDFWAEWCGPCRLIGPVVEELANEYEGKAVIGKLNVDDNREVAAQFGIMSIPTLLFFKDGQLVDKHVGVASKGDLKKKIDAAMA